MMNISKTIEEVANMNFFTGNEIKSIFIVLYVLIFLIIMYELLKTVFNTMRIQRVIKSIERAIQKIFNIIDESHNKIESISDTENGTNTENDTDTGKTIFSVEDKCLLVKSIYITISLCETCVCTSRSIFFGKTFLRKISVLRNNLKEADDELNSLQLELLNESSKD